MSYVVSQNSLSQSSKQNSLTPLGNKNLNFGLKCDHVMPLKTMANLTVGLKQTIFSQFSFDFLSWYDKTMTGPMGISEFCFPLISMFPSALPQGTLRVSQKVNLLFPLGPVIKCLLTECQSSMSIEGIDEGY